MFVIRASFFALLFLAFGCRSIPQTAAYHEFYAYDSQDTSVVTPVEHSPFFVVLLVSARHLNYTDGKSLLGTMTKHPRRGTKESNVGHAWVLLHGTIEGECLVFEGGHSGELGYSQPTYFNGVMDRIDKGDLNPISYLWEEQNDGFLQRGSGGHRPTYAIKVEITEEQYHEVLAYIHNYDYRHYSLVENQCASFVAGIAALVGLELPCEVAVSIPSTLKGVTLWGDKRYASITLFTPDVLERSMAKAVQRGEAQYVLPWYLRYYRQREPISSQWRAFRRGVREFPDRFMRYRAFR